MPDYVPTSLRWWKFPSVFVMCKAMDFGEHQSFFEAKRLKCLLGSLSTYIYATSICVMMFLSNLYAKAHIFLKNYYIRPDVFWHTKNKTQIKHIVGILSKQICLTKIFFSFIFVFHTLRIDHYDFEYN